MIIKTYVVSKEDYEMEILNKQWHPASEWTVAIVFWIAVLAILVFL